MDSGSVCWLGLYSPAILPSRRYSTRLCTGRHLHIMSHKKDGHPGAVDIRQQGHDLIGRGRVQGTRRFVPEDDLGVVHQSAANAGPLQLATRSL
jgi:hypothetical protein